MTRHRLTLLRGGHVFNNQQADTNAGANAMLIEGARVVWVGTDTESLSHIDAADEVVWLDGALVTPAFVDAHVHATATGLLLSGLDLRSATSAAQVLASLELRARTLRGRPVIGHGWDETTWTDPTLPTRAELDRASYGSVVYLSRIDVHSALTSSALLASVPDIAGMQGWSSDGFVSREAHHAVRSIALESITASQRADAQRLTRIRASELGIAAIHEMAGPTISGEADLAALLRLATDEPGPAVVGYWGQLASEGGLDVVRRHGLAGAAGDLFVDGAIGSRTACLHDAYNDNPSDSAQPTGVLYVTAAAIRDHVVACTLAQVQAGFHVIGDGAMSAVVEGLAAAAQQLGSARIAACRHRLEHAEMVNASQRRELARLSIIVSAQPVFDALWGMGAGMYEARLGSRASDLNPFAGFIAEGVPLAFGSDSPVTSLGPWEAVRAANGHRTELSRISVWDAFAAHTSGAWHAGGSNDAGMLAPGQLASYAVWTGHAMAPNLPGQGGLPDFAPGAPTPTCVRTTSNGKVIYDSGALQEVAA